ncbi:MAG: nucleotidyltransferase family protein [Acidobacteriales bacterium]|nr:nucleotidyltransferase family protein [Terriglobales bacterium]
MDLAGIILAAGASRRMGAPKALLRLDGETFLERLIRVYAEFLSPVVVVLGAEADTVRGGLHRDAPARFVVNEHWPSGQLTSLQCGVASVRDETGGCFFTPVDCPRVNPATIAALVGAMNQGSPPPLVVMPRHGSRRGHPVGLSRELFDDLLSLAANESARAVVHGHPDRTWIVDVEDAGVLDDVDTLDDYQRLERSVSS